METSEIVKSAKSYLIFEGVLALLFGISILLWPGVTLATVITFVGIYGIISGIVMFCSGVFAEKGKPTRASSVMMGLVSVLFGLLILNMPIAFAAYSTLFIAMLVGIQGIYYIINSFSQSKETTGSRVMLLIVGVVSVLFMFWVIANPVAGAIAILFYFAMMLIITGATLIAVGSSLKAK